MMCDLLCVIHHLYTKNQIRIFETILSVSTTQFSRETMDRTVPFLDANLKKGKKKQSLRSPLAKQSGHRRHSKEIRNAMLTMKAAIATGIQDIDNHIHVKDDWPVPTLKTAVDGKTGSSEKLYPRKP